MKAVMVLLCGLSLSIVPASELLSAETKIQVKLEVTQSIQYFETPGHADNSIPLVAGRKAGVRAKVTVSDTPTGAKVKEVEGKLVLRTAAGAVGDPLAPLNPDPFADFLKTGVDFNREQENHTLNFALPELPEGKLKFEASIQVKFTDGAVATGKGKAELEAFKVYPPRILCVPIDHEMVGPASRDKIQSAIDLATSCFPLPEGDWIVIDPRERKMWRDVAGDGQLDVVDPRGRRKSDVDYILSELEKRRQVYADGEEGSYDYVVGFVAHYGSETPDEDDDESIFSDAGGMEAFGYSRGSQTVGVCTTLPSMVRKTFPHELCHMLLGEKHCDEVGDRDCGAGSVGWDIRKDGGAYARAKRTSFMKSGKMKGEEKPWITPETYKKLFDAFHSGIHGYVGGGFVPAAGAPPRAGKKAARAICVQGSFSPDGKKLRLDPVFRYPWKLQATRPNPGGRYIVRVIGSARPDKPEEVRFEARHAAEPESRPGMAKLRFFSVVIPFPEGEEIQKLDIMDADAEGGSRKRYGGFERDPKPPVIKITEPAPGAKIEDKLKISWDVEGKAEPLLFTIVCSPDGGKTFRPLAVNLKKTRTFVVHDIQDLAGSTSETGTLIRIYVSDGLNNDSEDVGGLVFP